MTNWRLINLLAFVALVVVNFLAVQLPFFGRTPKAVSDLFPNMLTPADFAFKIWTFIYLLLAFFVLKGIRFKSNNEDKMPEELSAIGPLFLISCLLNMAWLVLWQSLHIFWSFVVIFALWIVLMRIYYLLTQVHNAKWYYSIPISVYLGWVCISTLANLNILLLYFGFDFFGGPESYWSAGLIGLGILGSLLVLYLNRDIWFTLVLIWAFYGIYTKHSQLETSNHLMEYMTLIAIIVLVLAGIISMIYKQRVIKGNG